MKQKRLLNLLLVISMVIAMLLITGIVLAAGSADEGMKGGVADATPPQVDPNDLMEGFDDITNLPGWFMQNNSQPLGVTDWFQGNPAVFAAQAGPTDSYIGANYNNTSGGSGTISNWLLTPVLNLNDGDTVSFWTRTAAGTLWPDRLEVRMSTNGSSTNVGTLATDVGDFTTVLTTVNPSLIVSGYPQVWTEYVVNISGVPVPTDGRIAFRYFVTNGGPSGSNSNYIGIDTFNFVDGAPPAQAGLEVSKTPATQDVTTNGIANFTITVTNTGDLDLDNVNVSDAMVPDCDNAVGALVISATVSYNCQDVNVTGSYTNVVTVTSQLVTGAPGPTGTASAYVNYVSPTSVSLSGVEGNTTDFSPIWLVAIMAVIVGFGIAVRRKITA